MAINLVCRARTFQTSLVAFVILLPVRLSAQTSALPWSAINTGFVRSSSPTTILTSVVGQRFVGSLQGANSVIENGFLVDTLFRALVTSIDERVDVPGEYELLQNYPNPFNPSTTIRYGLPYKSEVYLAVYNTLGQQVTVLANGMQEAGYHDVQFDCNNLASGVYFYRLQTGTFVDTKKFLLLR